ncbi:MAG: methylmalonyl-CoA mutase family protein [Bacteroidota bacterium]|nr:methylmalonyl-CoA mutase family protein [Bacteroidota bacterium]
MAEKDIKLFNDFPPISTQEWEAKIVADLKGKDYEKSLVWRTNEGFNVRPYYRQENIEELSFLKANPGEFPFVRGNKKKNNEWFVRQDIKVTDFAEANQKALDILMKGVTSLGFVFPCCSKVTKEDLNTLLKDICLEAVEVNFVCTCEDTKLADLVADYIRANSKDASKVAASVTVDPLGNYSRTGKLKEGLDAAFNDAKAIVEKTADLKKFKALAVNGKYFNNAGATIVQELAFSLAQGAEYISQLSDRGAKAEEVARKIKFNFGISANYFMEIAKLRAGRLLWSNIVKAFGVDCDCATYMNTHSETTKFNMTVYDAQVNMLRSQTEAMSAVLGGADSISVLPFNSVAEDANDLTERVARNQQILLKEEAHLDKIVDPGAGSYYIENLTASIAEQAWSLFLEVQEKGGYVAALKAGFVQGKVNESAAKRSLYIAQRRENLLGVNQFPNFTESINADLCTSIFNPCDKTAEGAEIETIKLYRGAQAFEALRYKTDLFAKKGKRPQAFMLTMGNLAMRKARAQFACNFFAVAGFEVVDNNGFATVEEAVKAACEAKAEILVVCSSDDEYAELAPAIADQIKGNAILVVAGNPACKADLEAKGIKNFIHVKSNLLEDLKGYQKQLGIE